MPYHSAETKAHLDALVHDQFDADTAVMYRQDWESCLSRLPGYLQSRTGSSTPRNTSGPAGV